MKIEKYYDVGCDKCGKHMSTDFFTGMMQTRSGAERKAREVGFRVRGDNTLCPDCVGSYKSNKSKNNT